MAKLSKDDLLTLDKVVRYHKFDLKTLQEFYVENVSNIYYWFKLKNGTEIILNFFRENFCHLVGTHKGYPKHLQKQYQGKEGFEKIANGNMTYKTLEDNNAPIFRANIQRIEYFPFILQLLENAKMIKFNPYVKDRKISDIKADFILYDEIIGSLLHLGIVKEREANIMYAPETFFPRELNKKETLKYIIGQDFQEIIDRRKYVKRRGKYVDTTFDGVVWQNDALKQKFEVIKGSKDGAMYRESNKEAIATLLKNRIELVKLDVNGRTYIIYKAADDCLIENQLCKLKNA